MPRATFASPDGPPRSVDRPGRLRRGGSREARLEESFESHFTPVWRALRRFGVAESLADDAAQQVFLIFADRLAEVEIGRERSFLLGVAVRVAANARRLQQRSRETPLEDMPELASGGETPEQLLDRKQRLVALERALDALSFEHRSVFVLFELEGFTLPEIAETLNLALGTATSRLLRARKRFELAVLAQERCAQGDLGATHE